MKHELNHTAKKRALMHLMQKGIMNPAAQQASAQGQVVQPTASGPSPLPAPQQGNPQLPGAPMSDAQKQALMQKLMVPQGQ